MIQYNWKPLLIAVGLLLFSLSDAPFLTILGELGHVSVIQQFSEVSKNKDARLSAITGSQIDDGAAMTEVSNQDCSSLFNAPCVSLPSVLWVVLLFAYMVLLIGNFLYGVRHFDHVQWFWECLYTFCALYVWYVFDECRTNIWYPLYILKMGLIIFGIYVYYMLKKQEKSDA